jgi:RNA polymerase sigma-70 factor (ECF subfamily)
MEVPTIYAGWGGTALTTWVRIGDSTAVPAALVPFPMAQPGPKALSGATGLVADAQRLGDASMRAIDDAMDLYARGDDAAFAQLYRHAAPRVRGFLMRMSGDLASSDDLVQETLLRVSRARGSFEEGAAAWPWILTIARNVFLDATRHAQVRTRSLREAAALKPGASPEAQGDEVLAGQELLAVVRGTLAGLDVRQREAFVLLRFEGLTVKQAAKVLGTTEGAVKIRAFRAYEALRAAIDKHEGAR